MQTEITPRDEKGRRHGLWTEWYHTNNQIMYTGEYVHGMTHGTWIGYHKDGSLWYKENFDMGKRIGYYIQNDDMLCIKRFHAR